MLIEFELHGSRGLHKGVFETTGFWARFEEEAEIINGVKHIDGYKIISPCSFSFYHTNKSIVEGVYMRLIGALLGQDGAFLISNNCWQGDLDKEIGFIESYER